MTVHYTLQIKKGGGISFNSTCPLSRVDEKLVQMILHEYKIFNAEVMVECIRRNQLLVLGAHRRRLSIA